MPFKPGDYVYYIGDWDCCEELPTKDDLEWEAAVVVERSGKLFAVNLSCEQFNKDGRIDGVQTLNEKYYFATIREALYAAAKNEQDYGEKSLALAARLRELASSLTPPAE